MLQAKGLSRDFGAHRALTNLNLTVNPGEIYCLLGANGAGKTTTINLFLNFIEPTAGEATICGLDVTKHPVESKRHVAYIPEQVNLYKNLSGLENLEYFTALAGHSEYTNADLRRFLMDAGLAGDAVDKRVSTYSKGMRQKVGIALATAKKAQALLLDEPTSGLDPKASNEFSELLLKMRDQGLAILMATHDLFRAKETGTRIGIMKAGVLVDEIDPASIGHDGLEKLYLSHMRD